MTNANDINNYSVINNDDEDIIDSVVMWWKCWYAPWNNLLMEKVMTVVTGK